MHESTRAPSLSVPRILALPQRVLSTHISLRALARRTRFRRSIPETPGFALGSNVRHSASSIASGRSMPPHPVSCSCCIGINSGFMLILHWTILRSGPVERRAINEGPYDLPLAAGMAEPSCRRLRDGGRAGDGTLACVPGGDAGFPGPQGDPRAAGAFVGVLFLRLRF